MERVTYKPWPAVAGTFALAGLVVPAPDLDVVEHVH